MAAQSRPLLGWLILGGFFPFQALGAQETGGQRFFDQQIAPLLARRCLDCHAGAGAKRGLDLSSQRGVLKGGKQGPALVAGKPEQSLLWELVEEGRMPPKKPLPPEEKKLLKDWIAGGATWGADPIDPFRFTTATRAGYDWWALQPVKPPPLPAVKDQKWPRNAIDHFILAGLEGNGLTPTRPADRRALIRRLSFDLLGLPPSPEDVETFLKDNSPTAFEKLVDRLLASPHYGERWARHWLDVARFGESHGFEHDQLRTSAWPYRDWVIEAFNRDLPYPEFARLQIAGDVLHPGDPGALAATGYLVAGPFDSVGQVQQSVAMKAVVRQDELEDIVGTVGQTFLGLTVNCARCHDHKFDPIKQTEYYRLTAALGGVRHGERDLISAAELKRHEQQITQLARQLAEARASLEVLEKPHREEIFARRKKLGQVKELPRPAPASRWDFTKGLKDPVGGLDAQLQGDARLGPDGLILTGKTGFAATVPLAKTVKARTMAVWVRIEDLQQRGGAAISLQSRDGQVFDAIVFGERQPGHWLAGSDGFQRTRDLQGPEEKEAVKRFVHLALVHAEDGSITVYRDGLVLGHSYRSNGPVAFAAAQSQFVFGLRHAPAAPGKMLAGIIRQAEFFERALSGAEIAALAGLNDFSISDEEWANHLDGPNLLKRANLLREIAMLEAQGRKPPPAKKGYVVTPSHPEPAYLLLRGNPGEKGPLVTPGGIAALTGLDSDFGLKADADDRSRRLKLAHWITSPENPLFARVIVNRLWQYHFGQGLVETPNDFGFNGGRPSHPALLDWLAAEFWKQKGSLKAMHRLMVLSAAYRQDSRWNPAAAKLDAGNRLVWRKNPLRLEGEAVRDAILSVSGRLNRAMGGPGYQDFKLTVRGATHYYLPFDADDQALERRSIYRTLARSGRSQLLDSLDCPDPSTVAPRRAVTTTPLQALALLNNPFVLRQADHFAKRLAQEEKTANHQIIRGYFLAFGRPPSPNELNAAQAIVSRHGLPVFCRALFNSSEFVYVD